MSSSKAWDKLFNAMPYAATFVGVIALVTSPIWGPYAAKKLDNWTKSAPVRPKLHVTYRGRTHPLF